MCYQLLLEMLKREKDFKKKREKNSLIHAENKNAAIDTVRPEAQINQALSN